MLLKGPAALSQAACKQGKALFDYLTEDRTRLYPAAAFEEIAADLLRLALFYGPAGLSLQAAALAACEAGMTERLSDKAVLGRLRRMGDWLEHLLDRLLADLGGDHGMDCYRCAPECSRRHDPIGAHRGKYRQGTLLLEQSYGLDRSAR